MFAVLAFDIEATGQLADTHWPCQVGAAVLKLDARGNETTLGFGSYIRKPASRTWEERCVREFWSKHPELYKNALLSQTTAPDAAAVARSFVDWCKEVLSDVDELVVVSDNVAFDTMWLNWLLNHIGVSAFYAFGGYRDIVDTYSFYRGVRLGARDADAQARVDRVWKQTNVMTHNAVDDAIAIARTYIELTHVLKDGQHDGAGSKLGTCQHVVDG